MTSAICSHTGHLDRPLPPHCVRAAEESTPSLVNEATNVLLSNRKAKSLESPAKKIKMTKDQFLEIV